MRVNENNRNAAISDLQLLSFSLGHSTEREHYAIRAEAAEEFGMSLADVPALKKQLERS